MFYVLLMQTFCMVDDKRINKMKVLYQGEWKIYEMKIKK